MLRSIIITATLLCCGTFTLRAQQRTPIEQDVLTVIDRFFAYMAARDSAGMASIMDLNGSFGAVETGAEARSPRISTHASYLSHLKKGKAALLERYWDATVRMDSGVAVVTCPYDFHIDGAFSHCGLDIFTLMKYADGWRIAGAVFSMRKDDCPPSPLGPVKK